MADRFIIGALSSQSLSRNNGAAAAISLYANTSRLLINHVATGANSDLLIYVSPTDQGNLNLNTIINQCARIQRGQIFNLNIGSERTRPSPGFLYANFITAFAGNSIVNFGQLVETY